MSHARSYEVGLPTSSARSTKPFLDRVLFDLFETIVGELGYKVQLAKFKTAGIHVMG